MTLLSIQNLTKEFQSLVAVDDVSFSIEDGEFVTVLGPSGSGKSTILRMIAGFEEPTSGSVVLDGEEITDMPSFERDVNMMFQDLALFPHLTVAENIAYGLKQSGVPKDERERRIEDILDVVHLSGYGDRDPGELSGGEQQRVALARAVVNQPELILFDEPLGSLDRKLRQHMQFELQRIQQETGVTALYVTHNQEIAMSIADRLILLNGGEIEQSGTVEDLYDHPESQFVADFIGDVNTIPARVASVSKNEVSLTLEGSEASLSIRPDDVHSRTEFDRGLQVSLCVRPHSVRLTATPSSEGVLQGTIQNSIYKGDEVTYLIDIGSETITVSTDDGTFAIGDEVSLSWSDTETYVFPREG